VGGSGNAVGNRFVVTDRADGTAFGVWQASDAGGNVLVRFNKFGYDGDNRAVPGSQTALYTDGSGNAAFLDNNVAQHENGILAFGSGTLDVHRNRFVSCACAVQLRDNVHARLGQLDDGDPTNNGGNRFRANCTLAVFNDTPNDVPAEGNDWATTSRVAILTRIHDGHLQAGLGLVDFDPLLGGVSPTAIAGAATIITSAQPTACGAEIAVQTSTAGSLAVTVLNLAGRLVAVPAPDQPCGVGLCRVLWNGRSVTGTRVPAGQYLVRVTLRAADGTQATSLCGLSLRR